MIQTTKTLTKNYGTIQLSFVWSGLMVLTAVKMTSCAVHCNTVFIDTKAVRHK